MGHGFPFACTPRPQLFFMEFYNWSDVSASITGNIIGNPTREQSCSGETVTLTPEKEYQEMNCPFDLKFFEVKLRKLIMSGSFA
jgi:hypothetical protein